MGRRGLWTGLHLEQISDRLADLGISVCPNTVRRLLQELDYALHVNRKSLSGPQSPERDRQFRYLQGERQEFGRRALPIVSVDTKKKELVGPSRIKAASGVERRSRSTITIFARRLGAWPFLVASII